MNERQAADDFTAFTAPDPETAAQLKKKSAAAKEKNKITPENLKAAEKLGEDLKAEKEAGKKSELIQRISDYIKHIKEFYPERVEFIKVPKTYGPKNSVAELTVWVKDLENELGKRGGLDVAKVVYVEAFTWLEKLNEKTDLGLKGIEMAARMSLANRRYEPGTMIPGTARISEGEIVPGPAVPTLAELCVKYSSWMSASVEVRFGLMIANMISSVRRANEAGDGGVDVKKASKTPVSEESADLMNQL